MNLTTDPIPTAKELFDPPTQDRPTTEQRMTTLEASIEELERKLDVAEKLRGEAALRAALEQDTPNEAKQALQDISSQMAEDRQRLVEFRAAHETYRIQKTEFKAHQKIKDTEEAWSETAGVGKQRVAVATAIRDLIKELHEKTEDLIYLSEQMHKSAPTDTRKNLGFTELNPASITEAVRVQMAKAGFKWAFAIPFGADSMPSLIQKVMITNKTCLSHRKASEAKTA